MTPVEVASDAEIVLVSARMDFDDDGLGDETRDFDQTSLSTDDPRVERLLPSRGRSRADARCVQGQVVP